MLFASWLFAHCEWRAMMSVLMCHCEFFCRSRPLSTRRHIEVTESMKQKIRTRSVQGRFQGTADASVPWCRGKCTLSRRLAFGVLALPCAVVGGTAG